MRVAGLYAAHVRPTVMEIAFIFLTATIQRSMLALASCAFWAPDNINNRQRAQLNKSAAGHRDFSCAKYFIKVRDRVSAE
jgi:hypothetical protein